VFQLYKLQFVVLDTRVVYVYTSVLDNQMSKYKGIRKW